MPNLFCQGCRLVQRSTNTTTNKYIWRSFLTPSSRTQPSRTTKWYGRKLDPPLPPSRQLLCPYRYALVMCVTPDRGFNDVRLTDRITTTDIKNVLTSNNLPFKEGHTGYLTTCKDCCQRGKGSASASQGILKRKGLKAQKKRRNEELVEREYPGDKSDLPLFIGLYTGDSVCLNCGTKQDWQTFKRALERTDGGEHNKGTASSGQVRQSFYDDDLMAHDKWLLTEPFNEEVYAQVKLNHKELRNIPLDMVQKFQVRCCKNGRILLFPYFDMTGKKVVGFKVLDDLSSGAGGEIVTTEKNLNSCFGWPAIKAESSASTPKQVIVTDSEINCIAVTAATGRAALSLPCGLTSLPPACLPFLESFGELLLWFGDEEDDGITNEHVQRLARKLGLSRCQFVGDSYNNTSLSILINLEDGAEQMKAVLSGDSKSMSHDHIKTFQSFRSQIFSELRNAKKNAGVQFKRFPGLNDYLGGHRCGELTIFTGPTGAGKTTFMSEFSLDLCMSGVRTLWGSFEVRNVQLITTMLHQYSGISLDRHIERVGEWSEQFERLPMYFMDYYGQRDLDEVLGTIEYAVYMYDIEHVIIDNLQFMIHPKSYQDKFSAMDDAIAKFRACASKLGVHVTVVVHPRKEDIGSALSTMSISGTAKAPQEADNVLILQSTDVKSIEVTKNRKTGGIGTVPLSFQRESKCLSGYYRDIDSNEEILPMLKPSRIQYVDVEKSERKGSWKKKW